MGSSAGPRAAQGTAKQKARARAPWRNKEKTHWVRAQKRILVPLKLQTASFPRAARSVQGARAALYANRVTSHVRRRLRTLAPPASAASLAFSAQLTSRGGEKNWRCRCCFFPRSLVFYFSLLSPFLPSRSASCSHSMRFLRWRVISRLQVPLLYVFFPLGFCCAQEKRGL